VVSRITEDTATLFSHLGQYEDSHGRHHEVYSVEPARTARTRPQGPSTGYTQTRPTGHASSLDDAVVQEVEGELARQIGPLAKVLVRKARPMALSATHLRELLAPTIPDARSREGFLQPPAGHSQPVSKPHRANPPSQSMPLSPRSGPSASSPSLPSPSMPAGSRSAATADELAVIEVALSRHIGPMGRVLARKEAVRHTSLREYVNALAATIDRSEQRDVFMQDLRRNLPRRPKPESR
jgi:serine/threonine-protein kinase